MWNQGRLDDVLNFYLRKFRPPTHAMEMGKEWDKRVNEEIQINKRLIPEFGNIKLNNPKAQLKLEVPYSDRWTLVGVLDIYDDPIIYEIKTGKVDVFAYSNDFQIPMYFLLTDLSGLRSEKAYILHRDFRHQKEERALIWKTPRQISRIEDMINTEAPKIEAFLNEKGVLA